MVAKVRDCAARLGPDEWVVGGGWALPVFAGGLALKETLDAVTGGRPAYLSAADGHSAWVNTKALALAGVDRGHEGPGERPDRAQRPGRAGGHAARVGNGASSAKHVPAPTPALRLQGLRLALAKLNAAGVTAVQEASASRAYLETYREAERKGLLTARVTVALGTDDGRGPEQVDELERLRTEFTSARVRPVAAKIFADGVIEGRTAAMIEPYLDRPGFRGEPNLPADKMRALVARLAAGGLQRARPRDRRPRHPRDARRDGGRARRGRGPRPALPDRARPAHPARRRAAFPPRWA